MHMDAFKPRISIFVQLYFRIMVWQQDKISDLGYLATPLEHFWKAQFYAMPTISMYIIP